MTHRVFWKVGLSNGKTFYENIPPFDARDNEASPWQRLQNYLFNNKCDITSLSLYTHNKQTWNLPSSGKNPKFKAFDIAEKPIDYNFFHRVGTDIRSMGGVRKMVGQDNFAVIEAIYKDYRLQVWVDNNNTRNSWVVVVKND